MHFQTVFASTHSTNPIFFSSSTRCFIPTRRTDPSIQCCSNVQFRNGFCSFRKRVSESRIVLRNHGGSIGIRCEGGVEEKDDGFYIRRCVELAKKAIGHTSPNPMVGCVLVKDGEVVGEGFHPKAGQPHAEVFALRDAGDLAENATAYVSLEPCNHFGRTPPCTEALIRAKVKRVVVGMVDPNPIVASKGVERLRESGIDVSVLVEEELCKKLNEAYIHRMLTGKPFVTLRYSLSTDGEISGQLGEGATELGGYYSQLLKEYDGVIMSSASLAEKSSFSTSQEPEAKQPLQIIVARNSTSPVQLPSLPTEATTQVIIFAENNVVISPETSGQGIETVILDPVNLNAILDYCGQQGLCSVLLDLSGSHEELEELLQEGLQQGLVQKVVMEVVPSATESPVQALENVGKAGAQLKNVESWTSNDSLVIEGYFDKAGLY